MEGTSIPSTPTKGGGPLTTEETHRQASDLKQLLLGVSCSFSFSFQIQYVLLCGNPEKVGGEFFSVRIRILALQLDNCLLSCVKTFKTTQLLKDHSICCIACHVGTAGKMGRPNGAHHFCDKTAMKLATGDGRNSVY